MSFYDEMALAAKDIIHGFKTGTVQLKRQTSALLEPDAPYTPSSSTYNVYDLEAAVLGVSADYVDGEMVKYDDLQVYTSPFFWLNGTEVQIEPQMSDELSIDGVIHRINKIERVPAAGTVSAFFIFVKG